ncbi:MAG: DoxX family protein [bacterium]
MNFGMTVLRVSMGLTMLFGHGVPKLFSYSFIATKFPDPFFIGAPLSLGLVIFAEFFCSILLIFGTALRLALIPLIVTMATAVFLIHGADPFAKKELALLYLCGYCSLFVGGGGCFAFHFSRFVPDNLFFNWLFDIPR